MSYKDDYNKAVFLNAYGNGKPLRNNNEYQRYFEFECEITNPQKYHKDLIKTGFLQPSPAKDVILSLKVSELKTICDSLGISKTGKKQDLVDRIASTCSSEQMRSFVKEPLYSLSEKGISYLNEHDDYVKLHNHKNWEITLDEYIEFKHSLPFNGKFRDVAWSIFNKRIIEYAKNYGFLRNNYLHMSYLMKEENKHNEELKYLLYVLFFDICGADIIERLRYCDTKKEALEKYYCFGFNTVIPSEIFNLQKYYNEAYVKEIYSHYQNLPLNLCDAITFKELLLDIFNNCENFQEKYEKIFQNNYQQYVDERFGESQLYNYIKQGRAWKV